MGSGEWTSGSGSGFLVVGSGLAVADFRRANLFAPGKLEEQLLQREPQVPSSQLAGDTRPRGHAGLCLAALEGGA